MVPAALMLFCFSLPSATTLSSLPSAKKTTSNKGQRKKRRTKKRGRSQRKWTLTLCMHLSPSMHCYQWDQTFSFFLRTSSRLLRWDQTKVCLWQRRKVVTKNQTQIPCQWSDHWATTTRRPPTLTRSSVENCKDSVWFQRLVPFSFVCVSLICDIKQILQFQLRQRTI